MTLVASVRVPDGIVVGADSLATLAANRTISAQGQVVCPECGKTHEATLPVNIPAGLGTISTLPYALKLMPFGLNGAIGSFGTSMFQDRTVFSLLSEFGHETTDNEREPIKDAAERLGSWMMAKVAGFGVDLTNMPDNSSVVGFQISGYSEDHSPMTHVVRIGKDLVVEGYDDYGVTVSGETAIITELWKLKQTNPQMGSSYKAWSVLDARDYVRFIVSLTADFQRFATMIPTVGGAIDLALITPEAGFQWLEKKELVDLLLPSSKDDLEK